MGVVHVAVRDERVKERLYGGSGHLRRELAPAKIGDHLPVVHLFPLHERQDLREPQARELFGRYVRQVATRALDPQDLHLPAGMVPFGGLDGGIAPTVVRHGTIRPQEVGAVGQRL